MKIKIEATVRARFEIDVDQWAKDFGVEASALEVADDAMEYFQNGIHELFGELYAVREGLATAEISGRIDSPAASHRQIQTRYPRTA